MFGNHLKILKLFFFVVSLTLSFNYSIYAEGTLNALSNNSFGVAIKGYDTVAYHTEGRAVKGSSQYVYTWNDAEWRFSSAENRDLFAADPERYAPQYGGYWAGSLATTGKAAGADPEAFKIVDGKLYLNWDTKALKKFESKAPEYIRQADMNWKELTRHQE